MSWPRRVYLWLHLLSLNALANGFSWQRGSVANQQSLSSNNDVTQSDNNGIRTIASAHELALQELERLESKPTCHRIAARQLMNNCRLLYENEESALAREKDLMAVNLATAYAISLALCDLSRGGFRIPSTCEKFGETTVANLPVPKRAVLHVSSEEIDACLQSLAQVDSLWGTFMSYNHKSAGFCHVARAENEKDTTILLHKKITLIMTRLTDTIDKDLELKLNSFNSLFEESQAKLAQMQPEMQRLTEDLASIRNFMTQQVAKTATASVDVIQNGFEQASSLREILQSMVLEFQSFKQAMVEENVNSLAVVAKEAQDKLLPAKYAIAETMSLAKSLQQLVQTGSQALESANRQYQLEKNLHRLEATADRIRVNQETHEKQLVQAQLMSREVLASMEQISSSTQSLRSNILNSVGWNSWWPLVACPVATLLVGSYKLAPSLMRNLALLGLGEIAGLAIVSVSGYAYDLTNAHVLLMNMTAVQ